MFLTPRGAGYVRARLWDAARRTVRATATVRGADLCALLNSWHT